MTGDRRANVVTLETLCSVRMAIATIALVEAAERRETVTYKHIADRIVPKLELRSP